MILSEEDDQLIRRYFLGDVGEDERRRFEERIFTDSAFQDHVVLVEDELFEDYVANLVSKEEREKFERQMLRTPEARDKLNIIGAMHLRKKPALATTAPVSVAPSLPDSQRSSWFKFTGSPARALAYAAILLVLLSIGLWYFIRDRNGSTEATRRQQLESEIAALNRQGLQPADGRQDLLDVKLTPGQLRGNDLQTKLTLPEKKLTVRFRLEIPSGRDTEAIGVVVLDGENKEVFSYSQLTVVSSEGQKVLVLDVPGHAFTPDDYVFKLRDNLTGQDIAGGDYSFRVRRP